MAPDEPPHKPPANRSLLAEIGLAGGTSFARDKCFYGALLAAPLLLMLAELVLPAWRTGISINAVVLLGMVLLHPLLEELLFRGVIQGVIQGAIHGAFQNAMQFTMQDTDQGRLQATNPAAHQKIVAESTSAAVSWLRRPWLLTAISPANLLTTGLFALFHLLQHSPVWAAAVIVPSLVFGYFRDRHGHIYAALILHASYNACYLVLGTYLNVSYPL